MRLARIAGIDFKANKAFLLLCVAYTVLGLGPEVILITTAVLAHEIAHTVVALALGVRISEVELLPFVSHSLSPSFSKTSRRQWPRWPEYIPKTSHRQL
jgi:stage IV sporulation protein FB